VRETAAETVEPVYELLLRRPKVAALQPVSGVTCGKRSA